MSYDTSEKSSSADYRLCLPTGSGEETALRHPQVSHASSLKLDVATLSTGLPIRLHTQEFAKLKDIN